MDAERYRRVKAILLEALEHPAAARAEFVAERCGDDPELRREVEELLAEEDSEHAILDEGVLGAGTQGHLRATIDRLGDDIAVPDAIGPYTVVGVLGEGGMGTVYHGRQTEPVVRDVAVKVLRPGMDGRRVLARFEWERKALARLDHPNIARVLDAGTDEATQRPYVALPLIEGDTITAYCDKADLPLDKRLQLFLRVCRAVEHAHARGVLHRDLKPGNVMVQEIDGEAVPVVIDFGIAKALDDDTTGIDATMTVEGQRIGTPAYMSPEQLHGDAGAVDVRSDVYALGVILWEMLAGRHPFGEAVDSVTRALQAGREPPPLTPPSRERTTATGTADRWRRRLRGDLDTICLRAVEFQRERRYASAAHLADDVQRFLEGRPILARPDSFTYRLGKSIRRHPVVSVAVAGAIAVLLTGAGLLAISAQRLSVERDRAVAAEQRARVEAEQARSISTFLTELFTEVDPVLGDAADLSARQLLRQGAERARRDLDGQPALRGPLLNTIGFVQHQLGLYTAAESLLVEAIDDLEQIGTARGDSLTMEAYRSLAINLHDQGRYAEGEAAAREALALHDELFPRTKPSYAVMLSDLAVDVQAQGRIEEAIDLLKQALALQEAAEEPRIDEIAWTRGTIGYVLSKLDRIEESERWLRSAYELFVTQPEDEQNPWELVYHLNNLGGVNLRLDRYEEAQPYLGRALEVSREMHGEDHAVVGRAYNMLGNAHLQAGEIDVAAPLIETGYEVMQRVLGPDHMYTSRALNGMVALRRAQERFDEAVEHARESLRIRRAVLGEDHQLFADTQFRLADCLLDVGEATEALALVDSALVTYRAEHEPTHARILELRTLRADALAGLGRSGDAADELEGLVGRLVDRHGADDEWTRRAREVGARLGAPDG
jgi:serine/threonine protein kinase